MEFDVNEQLKNVTPEAVSNVEEALVKGRIRFLKKMANDQELAPISKLFIKAVKFVFLVMLILFVVFILSFFGVLGFILNIARNLSIN